MEDKRRPSYWLLANLTFLGGSLIMPWFATGFEGPSGPAGLIAGWEYFPAILGVEMEAWGKYGFDWYGFLSILVVSGGFFVGGYLVFGVAKAVRQKWSVGNRAVSAGLTLALLVLVLREVVYRTIQFPLPGFWCFAAGLLSSAIFEWKYANTDAIANLAHK